MPEIQELILREELHIVDPLNEDFKQPNNIEDFELNYRNVRGNVRLQQKKVLTPKSFEEQKNRVIHLKLK